ncbi:MAG: glutathione transferase GstA [Nitrosomonadales bacterium]|nr:glutathione transferase GstA [Nitrosomonadales bacterium]
MQKLYYVPGTCALCPHIVLHEAGIGFTAEKVNPKDKTTESGQDYNAINPKGYVPALLMNNGELLTEVAVIVQYIADLVPDKKLAPPAGTMDRYHLQEWLNFISSEIHKGYSPLFNPRVPEETKTVFRERLAGRLNIAAKALASKDYLMGKTFTVADAYLYTVLRWSPRMNVDLSPVLQAYMERIAARPAVKAAMAEEGLQA